MKPTPGNWTYDPRYREITAFPDIGLADVRWHDSVELDEAHANGYLMAAAPNLRDELTNLSRAVRNYFDTIENDGSCEEDIRIDEREMEVMLARAERALATIFPPEPTS